MWLGEDVLDEPKKDPEIILESFKNQDVQKDPDSEMCYVSRALLKALSYLYEKGVLSEEELYNLLLEVVS